MIKKIMDNPWYVTAVMFIIMPINGVLLERGEYVTGVVLILAQAPWWGMFVHNFFVDGWKSNSESCRDES